MSGDCVVTLVIAESEREVRVDRVETIVLQRVRANLVEETDATTLLPQVEQNSRRLRRQPLESDTELVAAVAAHRP